MPPTRRIGNLVDQDRFATARLTAQAGRQRANEARVLASQAELARLAIDVPVSEAIALCRLERAKRAERDAARETEIQAAVRRIQARQDEADAAHGRGGRPKGKARGPRIGVGKYDGSDK